MHRQEGDRMTMNICCSSVPAARNNFLPPLCGRRVLLNLSKIEVDIRGRRLKWRPSGVRRQLMAHTFDNMSSCPLGEVEFGKLCTPFGIKNPSRLAVSSEKQEIT